MKNVEKLDRVIIRFAGDSGDGMQLTGDRFTSETAALGNDLATFPDFPAEIRAPAGSLPGVSGFQVHFADHDILTAGDRPDVLVAMNPAALRTNIERPAEGRHRSSSTPTRSTTATCRRPATPRTRSRTARSPTTTSTRSPLTSMTVEALKGIDGITSREAERSKNFFALGLMSWLYHRPTDGTRGVHRGEVREAARDRGGEHAERSGPAGTTARRRRTSPSRTRSRPRSSRPAPTARSPGNTALSYGLIAASKLSGLPLFLGAYPITPASSILEELAGKKEFGVVTFQAEDEIAAVGAALGAAFGGALGVTASAGPGVVLKAETVGLAIALELPLVILDIQRAGPSTGMPTKPEQADLLMVLFGRNGGEPRAGDRGLDPVPVLRRRDRGRAHRGQVPHPRLPPLRRVPRERLGAVADPRRRRPCRSSTSTFAEPGDEPFQPYRRDPVTLARPWAIPGTPGLEHRIGGLEKADVTGAISYDPDNHDQMVRLRAQKVAGIAADIPELEVDDPDGEAELLVVGLGVDVRADRRGDPPRPQARPARSRTRTCTTSTRSHGTRARCCGATPRCSCPEMNLGQLALLLRAEFLVDAVCTRRCAGRPLTAAELEDAIVALQGTP